ncbi:MAG TPA: hypothetical protein VJ873_03240, partial [bacterium]|nr:hypothetical protein [bacterium]
MRLFSRTFLPFAALAFLGATLPPWAGAQTINIVVGNCAATYTGDGGPATQASLWVPDDIAFDSSGNYYVADAGSNTIRKVTVATGIINTFAGTLNPSGNPSAGNGGPATQAVLDYASAVAFDSSNNLYIADFYYGEVRKVDASTGIITAFAGTGVQGYSGDGGPATLAQIRNPAVVRFDPTGRYLAISDLGSSAVREVDTVTGLIQTVAGNSVSGPGYSGNGGPATLAQLSQPDGLAFDALGNLYIADNINGAVREVNAASGLISTVAGSGVTGYFGDNGPATLARLSDDMGGLSFTCDGSLLIADGHNNRVRKVDKTTGIITTVIGTGGASATCSSNGTGVLTTEINLPQALAYDSAGNLYLVDYGYSLVQEVPGGLCLPTATPTDTTTPTLTPTITFTVT